MYVLKATQLDLELPLSLVGPLHLGTQLDLETLNNLVGPLHRPKKKNGVLQHFLFYAPKDGGKPPSDAGIGSHAPNDGGNPTSSSSTKLGFIQAFIQAL